MAIEPIALESAVNPQAAGEVTYSANYVELWGDTTGLPRKNLKRRPAGLPDELTTKLDLVIKPKKTKTVRLTIPPSLVALFSALSTARLYTGDNRDPRKQEESADGLPQDAMTRAGKALSE